MKAIKFFIIIITTTIIVAIEVISLLEITKDTLHLSCLLATVGIADISVIIGLIKFDNWFDSKLK